MNILQTNSTTKDQIKLNNKAAKILIVEDELTMAFLLKKLLTDLGYEVCASVTTGEESIEMASLLKPDIVLMDIYLDGEMNGIAAAEAILTQFGIPVIYATADGEEKTINTAKNTYPLGYILKPYNKQVIKSTLEVALSIREVEARKNSELKKAYETISGQTQELFESFKSAKEIQRAILPTESGFKEFFPNSFILNLPKESLGGDFFWYKPLDNGLLLFGVIDCTGHGVPGALMSILVNYQLTQSLKSLKSNNELGDMLRYVDQILSDYEDTDDATIEKYVSETHEISDLNSGFDAAICSFDMNTMQLRYCGAKRPLYVFRDKTLIELRGNRSSVGLFSVKGKQFEEERIQLQKGDQVFMFSDGYSDQIGGPYQKRFKREPFKQLLGSIVERSSTEQHNILIESLDQWKGLNEQLDDIMILGIKI